MGRSARDPDLAAFVGSAHLGEAFVVVPRGGRPRLGYTTDMERDEAAATGLALLTPARLAEIAREASGETSGEMVEKWLAALRDCGVEGGRLALAGTYPAGAMAAAADRLERAGYRLLEFNESLRLLRKQKTESERREMARVATATCRALRAVAAGLAAAQDDGHGLVLGGERLTAGRLRGIVRDVFAAEGLEQPQGNIVSAGADTAVPHTQGSDHRTLRGGEAIIVDLYPKGGLYADCTRTFCVGPASEPLRRAHELVRAALAEATAAVAPGGRAAALQETACDRIEAAGWETQRSAPGTVRGYVHGLGHGVGYDLHELPAFRGDGAASTLDEGDVFTLEPGIYDPEGGFGVRLEDLIALTARGVENLTPLPYDLDPAAW